MKKNPGILLKIVVLIVLIFGATSILYSQGAGGPAALQNALAGGPPPPPGGGGDGDPIAIPLDSNALVLLVFSGIAYLLFHYRKLFVQEELSNSLELQK